MMPQMLVHPLRCGCLPKSGCLLQAELAEEFGRDRPRRASSAAHTVEFTSPNQDVRYWSEDLIPPCCGTGRHHASELRSLK